VVTVDQNRTVIADGAVAVEGRDIVAVGQRSALEARFDPGQRLGGPGSLVIPGLVNTHQHLTGDPLIRSSIPDNVDTQSAIFDWVLPVHANHQPADDETSATLALAESLLAGVTTTVEAGTVAHPDRVAEAFGVVGARGTVGTWGWDVDGVPWAAPWQEVIERQAALVSTLASNQTVAGWVTLVGHDLMSDQLAIAASELARKKGVGLTFHMSPTSADSEAYQRRTGLRALQHLDRLGVLGPNVLIAHAVHVDDAELAILASTDTAVAYCPWAYLRLGQGVTRSGRHLEMIERGIRVGLGCDSANAGDRIDVLSAARLATGLARDMTMDSARFGAHQGFEMATIGGAAAMGMAHLVGSLEVGKRADLVVIDRSGLGWHPLSADPVLQMVWGWSDQAVRDVVVDGRVVVADRRVLGVDVEGLLEEVGSRAMRLAERSGVRFPSRWPVV
jgi:5-methylthioadenosine/S-adenosylhomocysteine deaminase